MTYTWLLVCAVTFNVGDRLITRVALRNSQKPDEFLLVYQAVSTIAIFPVSILEVRAGLEGSTDWRLLALLAGAVLAWTGYSVTNFRAAALLEVSIHSMLSRLRLIFAAIIGFTIFAEPISAIHVVGLVVLLGSYLPISTMPEGSHDRRGVLYGLASALAISLALSFDKGLTSMLPPGTITLIGFAGSLAVSLLILPRPAKSDLRGVAPLSALAALAGTASYYFLIRSLDTGPASVVIPVYQAGAIMAVLLAMVFLNESGSWRRKLLAVALSFAGAIMVLLG